jgi:hypothetical protein
MIFRLNQALERDIQPLPELANHVQGQRSLAAKYLGDAAAAADVGLQVFSLVPRLCLGTPLCGSAAVRRPRVAEPPNRAPRRNLGPSQCLRHSRASLHPGAERRQTRDTAQGDRINRHEYSQMLMF